MDLGISYQLNEKTYIRGAYLFGAMDGGDVGRYFETTLHEPGIFVDYDIMPFLSKDSKTELFITGGTGLMFFYANQFDRPGPGKDLINTNPNDGASWSRAVTFTGGMSVNVPVTTRISLSLGGNIRYLFQNDFLDGYKNGDSDDFLVTFSLGARFSLGRSIKKGEIVTNEADYQRIVASEKTARDQLESVQEVHDKDIADKNYRIASLEEELNTLKDEMSSQDKTEPVNAEGEEVSEEQPTAIPSTSSTVPLWRVVIGSFPSELRAQNFIDKTFLDKSEMMIFYVEEINSFRVVYKSFEDINEALAARNEARSVIPDAWVIKF